MSRPIVAVTTFEAAKPDGSPLLAKTWESETDCVPTSRPPADLTAAITCRISRALAAIAALALAARTSTPNENEAEVGTPLTEPLPATVIESLERGGRAVDGVRALGPGDPGDGSGDEQE